MLSAGALVAAGTARAAGCATKDGDGGVLDLGLAGLNSHAPASENYHVLQSALDSAGAGYSPTIIVPSGIYRVSRPLRIRRALTLQGSGTFDMNTGRSGTIIVAEGFSSPILSIETDSGERLRAFRIAGLLFDCGGQANGISLRQCADFNISRLGVRASTGFGMEFCGSWDGVICDTFSSGCGSPDASAGAINIIGDQFANNTNSLHFIGARVESSRGPSLIIHPPASRAGPNNNIQFVASKFHHPAGDGSTPPTANLVLHPAQAMGFHGVQIFDAGRGFPVVEFGKERGFEAQYAFFGCDIDVRTGGALFGGEIGPGHQFFGCTLRTDPAAPLARSFHREGSDQISRIKSLNRLYRVTT
jgi:hypothetical protein